MREMERKMKALRLLAVGWLFVVLLV